MTTQEAETQSEFKDYCLILQVHPEADAGMVDAAYWHLARRFNEQADSDPLAKAKLDDLNEAYSVLGSPKRREEYFRVRDSVLGEGRLPEPPQEAPEPAPLAVMNRHRSPQRQVEQRTTDDVSRRFEFRLVRLVEPSWQNTLLVLFAMTAAAAALIAQMHSGIVLGFLLLAMAICGVALVRAAAEGPVVSKLLVNDLER